MIKYGNMVIYKYIFTAIYFTNTVDQMSREYQMFLLSVYRIPVFKWIANDIIDTH